MTSLSCTVSEILSVLKCTLLVISRTFSVSIRQFQLQATITFRLMCKHTAVNRCYISRGKGLGQVSNSKSDLQGRSRSWWWYHSMGHIRFLISLSLQLYLYPVLFPRCYAYQLFPKIWKGRVTLKTSSEVFNIYDVCARSRQYKSAHQIWSTLVNSYRKDKK